MVPAEVDGPLLIFSHPLEIFTVPACSLAAATETLPIARIRKDRHNAMHNLIVFL